MGQYALCLSNWTVCAIAHAKMAFFFTASKKALNFLCADKKKGLFFTNIVKVMINW